MLKNGLITSFLAVTALIALNPAIAQDLPDCASSGSDPDGDGYGWENMEPSRRGNTFSTCDVQWEQGIFFNSYVYQGRSASYNTQVAEIVFNPDGSYQEFRIVEFGGNEETASELLSAGSWRVTNNGYGMSFVNAGAVSGGGIFRSDDYSRLAQEIINGSEVFSVYSDDESRVSCTRL